MLFFLSLPFGGGYLILIANRLFEQVFTSNDIQKDIRIDSALIARDKTQISNSLIMNIDTLWTQVINHHEKDSVNHSHSFNTYSFLYDPTNLYKQMISRPISDSIQSSIILPIPPKEFYTATTDTIIYNADRTLCWTFIALSHKNNNGTDSIWAFSAIGKRKNTMQPFKIYIRDFEPRSSTTNSWVSHIKYLAFYLPSYTYNIKDIHSEKDNWPTLKDPDFFTKHPLFKKHDDSTYHFEWYKVEPNRRLTKDNIRRYEYPY